MSFLMIPKPVAPAWVTPQDDTQFAHQHGEDSAQFAMLDRHVGFLTEIFKYFAPYENNGYSGVEQDQIAGLMEGFVPAEGQMEEAGIGSWSEGAGRGWLYKERTGTSTEYLSLDGGQTYANYSIDWEARYGDHHRSNAKIGEKDIIWGYNEGEK